MTSIYVKALEQYGNQTHAEALFFHSAIKDKIKGLRVLLTDEDLEFSDDSYVGTDPGGQLYYYKLDQAKGATRYESDTVTNPPNGQLCARVTFYDSNSENASPVGLFLGDDYFNTVNVAGMNGYKHDGKWETSSADSMVEAHLKKDANSATITLDISKALNKVATMTTEDSDLIAAGISDINGHFHYDSLDSISDGTYVSYSNDRLVFYKDDNTSTTFTGYYIPDGRSDNSDVDSTLLGIKGTKELLLKSTVWK